MSQQRLEVLSRHAFRTCDDVFGRAGADDFATCLAAARTHVDYVIGVRDEVEVVFDDNDRRALVHQPLQDA